MAPLASGLLAVGFVGQASGGAAQSAARRCKNPATQPPNRGFQNTLYGVAATSGCKALAVGSYFDRRHRAFRTLIEHWNGTAWKLQKSRNPQPGSPVGYNWLSGVVETSPTNAWAVGSNRDRANGLIEHWDGKAWRAQLSPASEEFNGVAATSSTNAWAVGNYSPDGLTDQTLIEHWDGTSWQVQPSPNLVARLIALSAVVATSPTNAWAVGNYYFESGTLILHWDGTSWQVQPSPNPGGSDLEAVAATSSTNAWAVGNYGSRTLILHWDGTSWQTQPTPNPAGPTHPNDLYGVAATSATNAWAVGYAGIGGGRARTLVLHWNGTVWKVDKKAPSPGSSAGLYGVSATSPTNVWAVGTYVKGGVHRTLAMHWNGTTWRP